MGIGGAGMQDEDANINVIRSVWRRTKKGHIKVRDLQPEKDVKGGAGIAGITRTSSSIAEAPLQTPHKPPRSACEPPRASWLYHQLRAGPQAIIRKLFEVPAEHEKKAHAERIAKAQRLFLRWLKKRKK
jgi:hypothetical protein